MELITKNQWELEEQDFRLHSVWYPYEELHDIDFLVTQGLDRSAVVNALGRFQPTDSCAFALPGKAARDDAASYAMYLSARVATANGHHLIGYAFRHVIGVFVNAEQYILNPALDEESRAAAQDMERRLGYPVFPLTFTIVATGATFAVSGPSGQRRSRMSAMGRKQTFSR